MTRKFTFICELEAGDRLFVDKGIVYISNGDRNLRYLDTQFNVLVECDIADKCDWAATQGDNHDG